MKHYNNTTSKKHIMTVKPYKVTKKTMMDSYNNEDLQQAFNEVDNHLQNILVSIANTDVQNVGLRLVNQFMSKLTNQMKKATDKKNNRR
jgi:3-keto-L-gulonate-6-phosphate decarboxylase